MLLFLHDRGYDFFNLNRLTYSEINALIRAYNSRERSKERQYKRDQRRYKKR